MSAPLWFIALSVTAWLLHTFVSAFIWRRGMLSQWRFLFLAGLVHALGSPVALLIHTHYSSYFYLYWYKEATASALNILVISDILRAIPGLGVDSPQSRRVTIAIAVGLAVGCVGFTWLGHDTLQPVALAVLLNRCANVAWAALTIAIVSSVLASGVALPTMPFRIYSGYLLQIIAGLSAAVLYSAPSKHLRLAGNALDCAANCCVFAFWAWTFSQPETDPHYSSLDRSRSLYSAHRQQSRQQGATVNWTRHRS